MFGFFRLLGQDLFLHWVFSQSGQCGGRLDYLYEHGWALWQKLMHFLSCLQVNCAAVDAEGRLAITGSADGTGRVWDLLSAQCIHILSGHEHSSGHASGRSSSGLPACKQRGDIYSLLLSAYSTEHLG